MPLSLQPSLKMLHRDVVFHGDTYGRDADGVQPARDSVNPFFAAKRNKAESDSFVKRRGCDTNGVIDAFHILYRYATGLDGHEPKPNMFALASPYPGNRLVKRLPER